MRKRFSDGLIIFVVFVIAVVTGFVIAKIGYDNGKKDCDCFQHLEYIRKLEEYILEGDK